MIPNRLFIGVTVPLEAAQQIQEQLPAYGFLKTQSPENYHITLLFLGSVDELATIVSHFETIRFESFQISIDGINGFYKKGKLHVVYLSIAEGLGALGNLNNQGKALLPGYGDHEFPTFVAHVTLCRSLNATEIKQAEAVIGHKFSSPIRFEALQIGLYDSSNFNFTRLYKRVSSIGANP